MWRLMLTKQAAKDAKKLASCGLKSKADKLLKMLQENPYRNPPEFEKMVGDMGGFYARRINIQHRLVYEIRKDQNLVRIIRMWTHYE